jgi:hypothetical protein
MTMGKSSQTYSVTMYVTSVYHIGIRAETAAQAREAAFDVQSLAIKRHGTLQDVETDVLEVQQTEEAYTPPVLNERRDILFETWFRYSLAMGARLDNTALEDYLLDEGWYAFALAHPNLADKPRFLTYVETIELSTTGDEFLYTVSLRLEDQND